MGGRQFHLDAETYLAMMRSEISRYDELQSALGEATADVHARAILDLGCGTGQTALAVLERHPDASLVGIDSSDEMLAIARRQVPTATFIHSRLEDALPAGIFDLVVSAFAIHHLDAAQKQDLFGRVAAALRPGGRFAMLDVVVPTEKVSTPIPLEAGVDIPSSVHDMVGWLRSAGLESDVVETDGDLAILTASVPHAGMETLATTRVTRQIRAPRASVYRALIDEEAVQKWMVPDQMTSQIHFFDPREGGGFRITLSYETPTTAGKTEPQSDTFHGRFLRLIPETEVVQSVEFETSDPSMAGEMLITYRLADAEDGTLLVGVHENLPPGLSPAANELGWRMSLDKLAGLTEGTEPR